MIAWSRVLLLIACFVFLVDYHQAQILERQQSSTSCTYYNIIRTSRNLLLPYLYSLGITIFAMVYTKSATKDTLQTFHDLNRQSYLWQKKQYLFVIL